MSTTRISPRRSRQNPWTKRLDQLIAAVVLLNVALVVFDLTYIRFRDLYLRYLPQLPQVYDSVKGLEPYRDTVAYLARVDDLARVGINSPDAPALLADLRDQSTAMIDEDPFRIANKSGSLEKLKNRMRQHMGQSSAKASFKAFWSAQHLNAQNWPAELNYFNQKFRPILAANYYRPIDESGDFVDRFWRIDLWFTAFFAADIVARTLWIRQQRRTTLRDALLWRWYDLFLLLPFWRILRVIPLGVRLHEAGLLNLQAVQRQISRNIAENIVGEVTELVLLQTFRALQSGIQQGALRQILKNAPAAVEVNQVDEIAGVTRRLSGVVTQTVLPNIQPDLESVIHHMVRQAMAQTPLAKLLPNLPGLDQLSNQLSQQLTHQGIEAVRSALSEAASDIEGQQLMQRLGQSALKQFQAGLRQGQTLAEIEQLLLAWLEELKQTTVKRLELQDHEQTLLEAEFIRQRQRSSEVLPPLGPVPQKSV